MQNPMVPKESFELLQQHFDLLLKLASGIVVAETGALVYLFLKVTGFGERCAVALERDSDANEKSAVANMALAAAFKEIAAALSRKGV